MDVWKIHAALPGLNVPFYIRSAEQPTHEQINAVWTRKSKTPLKAPEEAMKLPLRDAYPAYTQVEKLIVEEIG